MIFRLISRAGCGRLEFLGSEKTAIKLVTYNLNMYSVGT